MAIFVMPDRTMFWAGEPRGTEFMRSLPITPDHAFELRKSTLPDFVLRTWNNLIVEGLDSMGCASLRSYTISDALVDAAAFEGFDDFEGKWFDVAGHFDRVGWDVSVSPLAGADVLWEFKPKGWQHLMLDDGLMEDVRNGLKKVTIRNGRRDIHEGRLFLRGTRSGDVVDVEVDRVLVVKFRDVPIRHIRLDGANSHEEMLAVMKRFYPDMDYDSLCTVIEWK
jgi:ASC-1-like (ASCH) protein